MVTYKFQVLQSMFFFLTIFCISFFLVTNILISQSNMETIDSITATEQLSSRHLILLQAKGHHELNSYDSQLKVQWLERKSKVHIITVEKSGMAENEKKKQKPLTGKTLRFKKPFDNNNDIPKNSTNEHEDDDNDDAEYTVNIESIITNIENDNYGEEDMYHNEENYYNDIASDIFQGGKALNTESKKPLEKFKSTENLNTGKNINTVKIEEKVFAVNDKSDTKNIADNKTLQKGITNVLSKTQKLVQEGIFWSAEVENIVPKGSSSESLEKELEKIKKTHIQELQPPLWNKCGRPKNGFVILDDGSYMCARYRDPHNKLVFGLDSIPVVSLSQVNHSLLQWKGVDFNRLKWKEGNLVAFIQWIPGISTMRSHVKMPEAIYNAYLQKEPLTGANLKQMKLNDTALSDIVQWGSMLIFDYLTGNYDRVASMQDAAMKENRPSIIQEHIRNLRKSPKTGKFWLIDNESGLLDAYDLLYRDKISGNHFLTFHKQMLQTMCIFQKSVAVSLQTLKNFESPHTKLEEFAHQHEPLLSKLPKDYTYSIFKFMFAKRLAEVSTWIEQCKTR